MRDQRRLLDAASILREELGAAPLPAPELLPQAIAAALELARWPRAQWPLGADPWERAVIAMALSICRLSGRWTAMPFAASAELVLEAAQEMRRVKREEVRL